MVDLTSVPLVAAFGGLSINAILTWFAKGYLDRMNDDIKGNKDEVAKLKEQVHLIDVDNNVLLEKVSGLHDLLSKLEERLKEEK